MPRDRKHVDVLIVGAGAAGLAAARDLSHAV
jgi:cation diffusion facilitator CzcD-associated flavoprotein CzcO